MKNKLDSLFFTRLFVPRTSQISPYPTRETAFAAFSCGSSNVNVLGMEIEMAGTIVHLLTAVGLRDRLLKKGWRYPFRERAAFHPDYFIAGNICPDGIMARKGYERQMKLHTHFRDGIPDGSFDAPGMVSLFEKRMKAFWQEHWKDEVECPGLYLGYVTHMMTDERFILEERPRFFEHIAVTGLTCRDKETFIRFNKETDLVDFKLLWEFEQLGEAREALERVPAYEIKGMITKEELTDSRKWILQHFFYEEHPVEEAEFLRYDDMTAFIENVTEEIMERLFAEEYLVEE